MSLPGVHRVALPSGVSLRPPHHVWPWGLRRGWIDSARGTSSAVGLPPPQTGQVLFSGLALAPSLLSSVREVQVQLQHCRVLLSGVCDDSLMSEQLLKILLKCQLKHTVTDQCVEQQGFVRYRILSFRDEADTGQDSNRT